MAITQEWLDDATKELAANCPLAANDPESIEALKAKVEWHDKEFGYPPSVSQVVNLARPFEQALQKKIDDAAAEEQREQDVINARRKERVDYLAGSDAARSEVIREFGERNQPQPERRALKLNRTYTESEQDLMSADEYKEKVLGIETFKQGSSGYELRPERPGERKGRRIKLSDVELDARRERERVIEANKQERRKVAAELKAAADVLRGRK